jgi:hypothetical protein
MSINKFYVESRERNNNVYLMPRQKLRNGARWLKERGSE